MPELYNPSEPINSIPDSMEWNMISVGLEFCYANLSISDKTILVEAVIKTKSYLEGLPVKMGSYRSYER